MDKVTIPGTKLQSSRFIFGTASLFNVGSRRARHALLAAAVDHGFTHFDTAPYYGFGWAERDLAGLIRSNPQITLTTKVGIYSPGGEFQPATSVFLRKAAGRLVPSLSRPTVDFSVARARLSLDNSLKRLHCENVAIYMLHEPEIQMLETEEWRRWLEAEVSAGRIGTYGLALTAERLLPFLSSSTNLSAVVQILDSLERHEADLLTGVGKKLQITYGYVSAARAAGSTATVGEILRAALARNHEGSIIVSTTRPDRLPQYRKLLETMG